MRDFLNIGCCPYDETPVYVGEENYNKRAKLECNAFIAEIIADCGAPPIGASLKTKRFDHDFGGYYEVVCYFDDEYPDSVDYAYEVESDAPQYWSQIGHEIKNGQREFTYEVQRIPTFEELVEMIDESDEDPIAIIDRYF